MTIKEIISTIRTNLKEDTVDSVLTNREIWRITWAYAITFIKQSTDKKRNIFNQDLFKTIVVKMKEVPTADLNNFGIPIDCTVYRSINKIPKIIESDYGLIFRYIGTLDRSRTFNLTTPHTFYDKIKITKGKVGYVFTENNYIYSNEKFPLLISALFSNLLDILKQEIKEGGKCSIMDLECPIPEFIISDLLKAVITQLGIFKQSPQDTTVTANPNN